MSNNSRDRKVQIVKANKNNLDEKQKRANNASEAKEELQKIRRELFNLADRLETLIVK